MDYFQTLGLRRRQWADRQHHAWHSSLLGVWLRVELAVSNLVSNALRQAACAVWVTVDSDGTGGVRVHYYRGDRGAIFEQIFPKTQGEEQP